MATYAPALAPAQRLRLILFHSKRSGRCRRVEGWLAQAIQHGGNHDTFELVGVSVDERPDLAQRFRIESVPTFIVVEGTKIKRRIVSPRTGKQLKEALAPWLHFGRYGRA